jgi:hypothetical protein
MMMVMLLLLLLLLLLKAAAMLYPPSLPRHEPESVPVPVAVTPRRYLPHRD